MSSESAAAHKLRQRMLHHSFELLPCALGCRRSISKGGEQTEVAKLEQMLLSGNNIASVS